MFGLQRSLFLTEKSHKIPIIKFSLFLASYFDPGILKMTLGFLHEALTTDWVSKQ